MPAWPKTVSMTRGAQRAHPVVPAYQVKMLGDRRAEALEDLMSD